MSGREEVGPTRGGSTDLPLIPGTPNQATAASPVLLLKDIYRNVGKFGTIITDDGSPADTLKGRRPPRQPEHPFTQTAKPKHETFK